MPDPADSNVPDWLADVQELERGRKGPAPVPAAADSLNWLDDLRLWYALEVPFDVELAPTPTSDASPVGPASTAAEIPDWLQSWLAPLNACLEAAPASAVPAAKPASPPKPLPAVPTLPSVYHAKPAPPEPPRSTPAPVATRIVPPEPPRPTPPPVAKLAPPPVAKLVPPPVAKLAPPPVAKLTPPPVAKLAPPAAPVVPAAVVAPPTPATTPPPAAPAPATAAQIAALGQKALDETGFDLATGQILDAVKFNKWKQQRASGAVAIGASDSNASVFEVFRKVRIAVERWIDDDANHDLIACAPVDQIKAAPFVSSLFRDHEKYGSEFKEKLMRHLELLVDNRSKYYRALAARG